MPDPVARWRLLAESGPLFPHVAGVVEWTAWQRAASLLESRLPDEPRRDRRIHQLYVPTLVWLTSQRALAPSRPIVAGLCAPQGAGKSTLARELTVLLGDAGLRVAMVSIDDFYLPREAQLAVAREHPGNRVLEHRGAPGTHDVALGAATLEALRALQPGQTLRIPRYDKSAHGGRGDRLPQTEWTPILGPVDVVLLEGWCFAFRPVPNAALTERALAPVNAALPEYERWRHQLDCLASWRANALEQIVGWRVDAEERSRAEGRPGLDRAATLDYIRRFLPVYATFQHTVTEEPPSRDRQISVVLDADRLPIASSSPLQG